MDVILKLEYVRLGRTNLLISRVAFGAMRLTEAESEEEAAEIVRKAYDSGVNFFDTSRKNPESEHLLGDALYDIRGNVILSTTTTSKTVQEIKNDLESSLMDLHCDSIDLYSLETEKFLPMPNGIDNIYNTFLDLKNSGKIKNIGIVTTNIDTAKKAVESGLYDALQFPFNMIQTDVAEEIVKLCENHDVGFIAMQPLGGGVLSNIPLAFGFLRQYESVIPIWGIKSMDELNQILYFNEHPPVIDEKFNEDVETIRNFFN